MPKKINDGLNKYERYRLKDVEAYRKKKREWAKTEEQRKKRTEYMRMWREKNREKFNQQARESHKRNRHNPKNIAYRRSYHYKKKYGVTVSFVDEMIAKQNGMCAICGLKPKLQRLIHLDHCHDTGKIRGILCSRCNGHLGWYEAHKDAIINYLIK